MDTDIYFHRSIVILFGDQKKLPPVMDNHANKKLHVTIPGA